MEQLLRNDGCIIFDWWRQCLGECPPDKLPLLVFKKNQHPFYCMVDGWDMADYKFLRDEKVRSFELPLAKDITGTQAMNVRIMLLSDFFRLDPEVWKREKGNLVKSRQGRLAYPE